MLFYNVAKLYMLNFRAAMEKLTELSELTIPSSAIIHKIPDTVVGIRERVRQKVVTNTSIESSKDDFQFVLNPNIPAEIDLRDCRLVVTVKPTKGADGGKYLKADQISTCQAPGLLLFESAITTVGGSKVLAPYDNHVQFIKLQTGDR